MSISVITSELGPNQTGLDTCLQLSGNHSLLGKLHLLRHVGCTSRHRLSHFLMLYYHFATSYRVFEETVQSASNKRFLMQHLLCNQFHPPRASNLQLLMPFSGDYTFSVANSSCIMYSRQNVLNKN